jgi:hypothetical protein
MKSMTQINYQRAKHLLKEGDVLLFRGSTWASFFIGRAGEGIHTHVAVASLHNDTWECVEFKENSGGRAVNLERQVKENAGYIDVFRPDSEFNSYYYLENKNEVKKGKKQFDGACITRAMRKMTGLPYGWRRIWWIMRHKLAGVRLLYDAEKIVDDTLTDIVYPVCSTSLAYAFSKCGFDLVKMRADEWTEPADIARSAKLNYLFTLH